MVARPNTDVWYGVPISTDDLHRLYRESGKDATYVGTRQGFGMSDAEHQAHGRSQLDFHDWVQALMMKLATPLYQVVDENEDPIPVDKWWGRRYAPINLLGYPWDAGKKVLIAFERPALEFGDVEEGEHKFKPLDIAVFTRTENACAEVVPDLLVALSQLGITPGPVGWYRHEYTN